MQFFDAVGRRKSSVARIRISLGTGKRKINERNIKDYFKRISLESLVEQPLKLVNITDKIDLFVNVKGGGLAGQAGAIRHAISKALLKYDISLRGILKKAGLLTRDARIVERKKTGQPKARKRFQFSKR